MFFTGFGRHRGNLSQAFAIPLLPVAAIFFGNLQNLLILGFHLVMVRFDIFHGVCYLPDGQPEPVADLFGAYA
jgi:hypothetical protein